MINKVLLMEFFKDDDIKLVDKDFYIKSQMKNDVIKYITILEEENEELKEQKKKAIEYININKKEITQNQADFYDGKNKLKVGTFMWNVDELLKLLGGDE